MSVGQIAALVGLAAWLGTVVGCTPPEGSPGASSGATEKVLRIPMPTGGPASLDPVQGSTLYENRCASQVYETLLQYKYLKRPPELEPLLLAEMPKVSEDGLTYEFKLKPGVRFHDDPCFPDGKGREIKSADVFYSWKRMANEKNRPKSWWLVENTIAGFDEYRAAQNKEDKFDYDATVEGFQIVNDQEFKVVLKQKVERFRWTLAMFQLAIVPREAVEKYGNRFGYHPVGTGPFTLREEDWKERQSMVFHKNPNYHGTYPSEHMPEDIAAGLTKPAGQKLPFVDKLEISFFVETQPQWLQFKSGNLDLTGVPTENFEEAFVKRTKELRSEFADQGVKAFHVPGLDFIFYGFNMENELVGGLDEKKKALRQAICLAMDWEEKNDVFFNRTAQIYDGPIPPGLEGYPPDGKAPNSFRGRDVQRAKEKLAEAGYPDGKGLPVIDYYTSTGGQSPQMAAMTKRQLEEIGVRINERLVDFSTLIEAINNKKATFFSFAWSSDYPDGENNLALFYGPNESPGSNHFNYKRAEYDKLYEQILVMSPSPERTEIMVKMRDMLIEDSPFCGSMARVSPILVRPWVQNYKPTDVFDNWYKYLDVDTAARR